MVAFSFDATQFQPSEPGMPVWEGPILHQITRSEIKPTAANDGSNMLMLYVVALDGHYRGQENVVRLNLWNKNQQAVDIAQRQLTSIAHVCNRIRFTDTDELRGIPWLGVWAKQTRTITDQQTGQPREVESCQCNEFKFADGRTVRESLAGQPPSSPYAPGAPAPQQQHQPAAPQQHHAPQQPAPGAPQFQGQFNPGGQPMPPAGGFTPPGAPQPGFQPGMPQPGGAPSGPGMAPPGQPQAGAYGGQHAPAPGSFQPPQAGPAIGTAPSGFNPGQPAPGYGQPGQPQPGGFQPPPAGGFQPPAGPQPGPGPWGPGAPGMPQR